MSEKIVAIGMAKDEADVIEHTIRHLIAHGVDVVLIADNLSTDGTPEILARLAAEFPRVVIPIVDHVQGYYQSAKMTKLMNVAHEEFGAAWVIPFDADELFITGSYQDTLRQIIEQVPPAFEAINVPMANHFPTCLDRSGEENPFRRLWRRHTPPNTLPKVIVRPLDGLVIQQGNHSAIIGARAASTADTSISIRHFPYRSEAQFVKKCINGAAAYKKTDLPATQGAHWRMYGDLYDKAGEEGLRDWFRRWFFIGSDRISETVLDPAPLRGLKDAV